MAGSNDLRAALKIIGLALLVPTHSVADQIGTVVKVADNANVAIADMLTADDIITTDATGIVHGVLIDRTRILIGPATEFYMSSVDISGSNKVKRTLSVIGGSMRFLSDGPTEGPYVIDTPSATMGIRGTILDVSVSAQRTDLIVHQGEVEFCTKDEIPQCQIIVPTCTLETVTPDGFLRP